MNQDFTIRGYFGRAILSCEFAEWKRLLLACGSNKKHKYETRYIKRVRDKGADFSELDAFI